LCCLSLSVFGFVYVFPVVAVLGIVSLYVLSGIPFPSESGQPERTGIFQSVKDSLKEMSGIPVRNVPYCHFFIAYRHWADDLVVQA